MGYAITTPIFYVNAEPHLGHAYTMIAADVLARHRRARGDDVYFQTGTDEHGEPVANAAAALGVPPRELADRNAERFRALVPRLNAEADFFIRTSDPRHHARVREIMERIHRNGFTYRGMYEGWYCPRCADFKFDRDLDEQGRCPVHEAPVVREREENWFFSLSAFQARLEQLYEDRPDFVLPAARAAEARSLVHEGLRDVSLSRSKLTWGVTVPWAPAHVFYVWFDALLNYYTGLSFARDGEDLTGTFWPSTHLIGRDILKFHTVLWPAMLMAADIEPPQRVLVHGFLLTGERKMSKSLGNTLDPFAVIERYGADALRYYLLRDVPFGRDGAVSAAAFETRYEAELADDLGNLVRRVLAMIERYCDGVVPAVPTDGAIARELDVHAGRVEDAFDQAHLTAALDEIWAVVRRLNAYVNETAPWAQAREPARRAELDQTLATLAEGLRVLAVHLEPFMPATAGRVMHALGGERTSRAASLAPHGSGCRLRDVPVLFPKIR
ncbi:MAG TPA: methionine--tRNA ligase [Solirubrobacteraceae bacterium]